VTNIDKQQWKDQVKQKIEDLVITLGSEIVRTPEAATLVLRAAELRRMVEVV